MTMLEALRNPQSLEQLELLVNKLAARIEVRPSLLPTYGWSDGMGRPHIEVRGELYHWVVAERGTEFQRRITADLDELLFWIFESVTSSIASEYELDHRVPEVDCRRLIFKHQLDLLGAFDPAWCEKRKREIELILFKYPFNDGLPDHL